MGNLKTQKLKNGLEQNEFFIPSEFLNKDLLVDNQYKVEKKIGSGSFGKIHICSKISNGEIYAVKFETESQEGQLNYEYKLYQIFKGQPGFPNVYHFGLRGFDHFMIMDYLGPNLESLFKYCDRKFSLKTVLMIADQVLCLIEKVHSKSFVYRDIKPENFVIGRKNQKNQIFIIDFGLSKLYRNFWTQKLNKYRNNRELVGTVRYSSINTHLGIEQSRRDDLESIGYMLVYFLKGKLPWQGFKASNNKERNEKICDKKVITPLRVLCDGLPTEFIHYLDYCKNLSFDDTPNYSLLRSKFRNLFIKKGYIYDFEYDWKTKHEKEWKNKTEIVNKNLNKIDHNSNNTNNINNNNNNSNSNSNQKNEKNEKNKKQAIYNEEVIEKEKIKKNNISSQVLNINREIETGSNEKTKVSQIQNENNNNNNSSINSNNNNNNKYNEKKKELINETLTDSDNENEIDPNMEEKLNELEERKKFYNSKQNEKLKLTVEHLLLKQQQVTEVADKQKELETQHFLRLGEIYSLKCRSMYHSTREIDEIIKNNPEYKDEKVEELISYIKMELRRNLSYYSLILLQNDHNNLLYLINEKKILIENGELISGGSGKKKKKKLKKSENKLLTQEKILKKKQMIEQKFLILKNVTHLREIKQDEKIQKQLIRLRESSKKNLSLKKLDHLFDDLDKLFISIQEKFRKD
ncbi:casein kinase i-like protein [Anaeramoeba flamelloides]|uniref:non-specific serine/threonine protein kinase n=1 Tax=Anaeramoeba flamelloides TaxID=1746091 RepID=A0ABQ8XM20_9EUKA|nr:casein kinase i-like protein [Anaeramoeba flamelloides]